MKEDIDNLIHEAKKYHFKTVCVNPHWVKYCNEELQNTDVSVCAVVGFPLGANTLETKVFETLNAISNGADEIDLVMNIGEFKSGNYDLIEDEITEVCQAAKKNPVKVIIETCYLTEEEIRKASEIVSRSEAKFIKTSTGFGSEGASIKNIKLIKENVGSKEIEAAGGIREKEDLLAMLKAGATRIGTSGGVKIVKNDEGTEY